MNVLVDYDNIDGAIRRQGLRPLLVRLEPHLNGLTQTVTRINVRLYGGWYDLHRPTRAAQQLATEIAANFPTPMLLKGAKRLVNVELAYSLLVNPRLHMFHTFRARGFPQGLGCEDPTAGLCSQTVCLLKPVHRLLTSGKCPAGGCQVTPADLFRKAEQKLVDTMLTADLIFLAAQGPAHLHVVSSDDDLWPGILYGLSVGATVSQIHTRGRSTNQFYLRTALGHKYHQASI